MKISKLKCIASYDNYCYSIINDEKTNIIFTLYDVVYIVSKRSTDKKSNSVLVKFVNDFTEICEIHPELAFVLTKNIDIVRIGKDSTGACLYIYISEEDFNNCIIPYLDIEREKGFK